MPFKNIDSNLRSGIVLPLQVPDQTYQYDNLEDGVVMSHENSGKVL
jgi:hypothetical protein